MTLIDTAGIRRRGKVDVGVEKYSVMRALGAIERSDVVLLVVDATAGVTAQDTHVAGFILEEFKSVAVIVNKWDAVLEKDTQTMTSFTADLREKLKFMDYVPILFISALTKQRISKVLPLAMAIAAPAAPADPDGRTQSLAARGSHGTPGAKSQRQATEVPVRHPSGSGAADLRHFRERSGAGALHL